MKHLSSLSLVFKASDGMQCDVQGKAASPINVGSPEARLLMQGGVHSSGSNDLVKNGGGVDLKHEENGSPVLEFALKPAA